MKFSTIVVLGLIPPSTAFAPVRQPVFARTHESTVSSVVLEMATEKRSKRKMALKTLGRVAGAVGTIALSTTGIPRVASAAEAAKTTKETADIVKNVGTLVAGAAIAVLGKQVLFGKGKDTTCVKKLGLAFPGALKNKDLVRKVSDTLDKYDFGADSLVATSLCVDEVNRVLDEDFGKVYGDPFNMGGLSGFPLAGVTGFGAMASHIPDGGSCLIVFGPHVGVDSSGAVGTVERRGKEKGGACCGSAQAAAAFVARISKANFTAVVPDSPLDAGQTFVGNMLVPYKDRLENAADKMVELPYAMFDAQKKMMTDIVKAGAKNVPGNGKIAVLGGIQVNTPEDTSDYFKPLSFEVYNNKGELLEDFYKEGIF